MNHIAKTLLVLSISGLALACTASTEADDQDDDAVGSVSSEVKKGKKPKSKPFKGNLSGTCTLSGSPTCQGIYVTCVGEGNATRIGHFTSFQTICRNPVTNVAVGEITKTADNGDTLTTPYTGTSVGLPPQPGDPPTLLRLALNYHISGGTGTGRFEGTTIEADFEGSAEFNLAVQPISGPFSGEDTGTITSCK